MATNEEAIRSRVRGTYAKAVRAASCCDDTCCSLYSAEELSRVPAGAQLGLGSGNPVRHAGLREGEVVLDLGSGAGVDVFLAASRIGPGGRAIGVDMTPEMVARARFLAESHGIGNAEFREGAIERLPVEDASVDVVLSNCVINLSPDKEAVFRESFRVLRPGGRLVISDIVKERPIDYIGDDCGCVSTAMVRADYLALIRRVGFGGLDVVEDRPWPAGRDGTEASAITLRAYKPEKEVTT